MYRAYVTRASEVGRAGGRSVETHGPLIDEMLALRHEEAQLLGYGNFAEVSLVPKMAESPRR